VAGPRLDPADACTSGHTARIAKTPLPPPAGGAAGADGWFRPGHNQAEGHQGRGCPGPTDTSARRSNPSQSVAEHLTTAGPGGAQLLALEGRPKLDEQFELFTLLEGMIKCRGEHPFIIFSAEQTMAKQPVSPPAFRTR